MRLIVIGCEYAGTTTLTDNIAGWIERAMGGTMGKHDHWKIPEVSHQPHTREENQGFLALSANLRESFQRYHMEYHLQPGFYGSPHHVMVGFHIDEAVYAQLYYGYGGHDEYGDLLVRPEDLALLQQSIDQGSLPTVYVGDDRKIPNVLVGLVCHDSDYFDG